MISEDDVVMYPAAWLFSRRFLDFIDALTLRAVKTLSHMRL